MESHCVQLTRGTLPDSFLVNRMGHENRLTTWDGVRRFSVPPEASVWKETSLGEGETLSCSHSKTSVPTRKHQSKRKHRSRHFPVPEEYDSNYHGITQRRSIFSCSCNPSKSWKLQTLLVTMFQNISNIPRSSEISWFLFTRKSESWCIPTNHLSNRRNYTKVYRYPLFFKNRFHTW